VIAPERADVWIADLGEDGKTRPVVVLSVSLIPPDRPLVAVVPRTTARWNSRFEVETSVQFSRPGAFNVQGLAAVSLRQLLRRIGALAPQDLARVEAAVRLWLGL
jgi:mRNA-degrading endonuclease toxin of MazEF toxin-antitoxin module